jgi:SAM-dependent methyltransferase
VNRPADNTLANQAHYDAVYRRVAIERLVDSLRRWRDVDGSLEQWLQDATSTHMSWHGFYYEGFASRLCGRRVLELGSGDGSNACVMAALGADVTANDVSTEAMKIITQVARGARLPNLRAIPGTFDAAPLEAGSFDYVVGKSFLHHLTHEVEAGYLARIGGLLRREGEARFVEPATNNKLLDTLRWAVPVPGRPSALRRAAFRSWKAGDPHPDRDNSSAHYVAVGRRFFEDVRIVPFGSVERLHRLLPRNRLQRGFRQWANRFEERLGMGFRQAMARTQTIILRRPRV